MANPTSNFGWQMPTPVDLVTDLPADFEVFGQAVDSSLADLKGGSTGQILSKNSNTDMDFVWVTSDDSNAIQNSIVDAKGDIIAATANDTPARLAVGTNNQVLTADSSTATGLKWATPSGSSGPAFRAFRNTSAQTIAASNTWTKVQFNGETFDTDSCFDSTTNYRFTPTTAGYYQINLNVYHSLTGNPSYILCSIYKNGSSYSNNEVMLNGQNYTSTAVSDLVYFNGSSDYVEGYALQQLNSTVTNGSNLTNFSGTWIRS